MILVTGATGTVGSELVRLLCAAGTPTRALARTPDRADALRGYDCEVAVGDYGDPATLDDALRGTTAVFLCAPFGPEQVTQESAVIDAAARASVRVVKLAAIGWDTGGHGRIVDVHTQVVAYLRSTGVPHTVLAPNDFLQNLFGQAAAIQSGVLALPYGDAAVSSIDARDVAAVAAHVLTTDGHEGASYLLTGPAALTKSEVAAALSEALGTEVRYLAVEPEQARAAMLGAGFEEWRADGVLELAEAARAGRSDVLTDEVAKATGRAPRSITDFLSDYRSAFA